MRALLLGSLLLGCTPAAPSLPGPAPTPPVVPDAPLPEPTLLAAGGPCRVLHDSPLGAATAGPTASAFDGRSGLAAWAQEATIAIRPMTSEGRPGGPAQRLAVPYPMAVIAPWEAGFLVVAQGRRSEPGRCPARCVDATCGGWRGPGGAPQVCSYACDRPCMRPGPVHLVAIQVARDGHPLSQSEIVLGDHPVIALAGPRRGPLAMVTAHGQLVELTTRAGAVALRVREAPLGEVLLPVRGEGPAAFLVGNQRGIDAVVTLAGTRPVTSDDGVLAGVNILRSGELDARYDAAGAIAIAWRGWLLGPHHIGYATLAGDDLQSMEPRTDRDDPPRPPFTDDVRARVVDGKLHRDGWLHGAIDEGVDLGPSSDAAVGWSGEVLAVTYRRDGVARVRGLRCPRE
ncbi:MAG: hypothetical protein KC731_08650 [Myxococcales bacterium]|nr:hypothetical protein [Myxococcales bacterium]